MARVRKLRVAYLDTHIVCWLYEGRLDLLSEAARELIECTDLRVSPMVDLELQFLYEIGRITKGPATLLPALRAEIGLEVSKEPFWRVIAQARSLSWTRDPFDRLLVPEVLLTKTVLVTKDKLIRKHRHAAVW